MRDLPRLAEGTRAEGFSGIQKLLRVKIADGWVNGELPNAWAAKRWWNPWEEYYSNPDEPPFLQLLLCGSAERNVVDFLQSYGTIVADRGRAKGHIAFPVALFHFEKWQFKFVAGLLREYRRPDNLRRVFLEQLDDAGAALQQYKESKGRGPWGQAVLRVWYGVTRQEPPDLRASSDGRADWTPLLKALKSKLDNGKPADIEKAAKAYVANRVTDKIKKLRLAFEIGENGPRSYAYSDDLLENFYWMLAEYFAGRKHLSRCAACGTNFVGISRYCPDRPECKERGRRRLDWDRNKEKYNRNRKRKRRLAKRAN